MKKTRRLLSGFIIFTILISINYNIIITASANNNLTRVKSLNGEIVDCTKSENYPVIFIPGILASWYSESGYNESGNKVKRWIPDPITNVYDPFIRYLNKEGGYQIEEVLYNSPNDIYFNKDNFYYDSNNKIHGNSKGVTDKTLFVFGYDSKRDNIITASLLNELVGQIKAKSTCKKVNIVGHSNGGLVARAFLSDMCAKLDKTVAHNTKIKYDDGYKEDKPANGTIHKPLIINCSNNKDTVANLITVGTPNYGSPKAFFPWVFGDMDKAFGGTLSTVLNSQLKTGYNPAWNKNQKFYNVFHGYVDNNYGGTKNGVISLGQLMPDKKNSKLSPYVSFKGYKETDPYYKVIQTNSFLGELNSTDKINVMLKNISNKYYLYYGEGAPFEKGKEDPDYSIKHFNVYSNMNNEGGDIYGKWKKTPYFDHYLYGKVEHIKNGDGTVPSEYATISDKLNFSTPKILNTRMSCDSFEGDDKKLCAHTNLTTFAMSNIKNILKNNNKVFESKKELGDIKSDYKYLGYYQYKKGEIGPILTYSNNGSGWIKGVGNKNEGIYSDSNWEQTGKIESVGKSEKIDNISVYEIYSPINLVIQDSQGRKIGVDPNTGEIINEIPGAWTSGDTEGSGEPEVFFIPTPAGEKHKILSYGTGDGEYHIKISNPTSDTGATVIAGEATTAFVNNYAVNFGNTVTYKDTDENIAPTLENVSGDKIITHNDNTIFKYAITGNKTNIAGIRYKIDGGNEEIEKPIDGVIELNNLTKGYHKLEAYLVDKNGDRLTNKEATINVNILYEDETSYNNKNILETAYNLDDDKSFDLYISGSLSNNDIYKNIKLSSQELNSNNVDLTGSIIFSRTYNSTPIFKDSSLGIGWNHNFDSYFNYDNNNGDIKIVLPNGKANKYILDKDFNYIGSLDNGLKIKDSLNEIIITDNNGDIYTFSKTKNRLIKLQYKNYPEYILNYDEKGLISDIKVNGCTDNIKFSYDDLDRLINIEKSNGEKVNYEYVSFTKDEYLLSLGNNNKYYYDDNGLLILDEKYNYIFDKNKVINIYDLKEKIGYNLNYLGNNISFIQKDEFYKANLSEQKIELNNLGNILNISNKAGIIQYNYTQSGTLESIKDEKGNIRKINNGFGEFKCSGNITSISGGNQNTDKIQKVIDKVDSYINKKTKGNPNDEIKTIRNLFVDRASLLKTPEKILDKNLYKNELIQLLNKVKITINEFVINSNYIKDNSLSVKSFTDNQEIIVKIGNVIGNVNIRALPNDIQSKIIYIAKNGENVEIINSLNNRYKIKIGNKEGYLNGKYLKINK